MSVQQYPARRSPATAGAGLRRGPCGAWSTSGCYTAAVLVAVASRPYIRVSRRRVDVPVHLVAWCDNLANNDRVGACHRLPAYRHRGGVRQRAAGRGGAAQLGPGAFGGLPGDQDLDQRLRVRADAARFGKSARKLGVDQIDLLLLLHQALPSQFEKTLQAYRALETLLAGGTVPAIGVSSFMVEYLTGLLERATVVPAVNQIEVHPYFSQPKVRAFAAERGILTQA